MKMPKKIRKEWSDLYDHVWKFCKICEKHGVPPEVALSLVIASVCSFIPDDPEKVRDVVLLASNRALWATQELRKEEEN